jgi:hypothetical protein
MAPAMRSIASPRLCRGMTMRLPRASKIAYI